MQKAFATLRTILLPVLVLATPFWVLLVDFSALGYYALLCALCALCLWHMLSPYSYAAKGPNPLAAQAKSLTGLGIRFSIVLWASLLLLALLIWCLYMVVQVAYDVVANNPFPREAFIFTLFLGLFIAYPIAYAGDFAIALFSQPAVLCLSALCLLVMLATPCVLGVRAVNAALKAGAIAPQQQKKQQRLMCIPVVNIVYLAQLNRQLHWLAQNPQARPTAQP